MLIRETNYIKSAREQYKNNTHRLKQLEEVVNENKDFIIVLQRKQTRYRQEDYVKIPYTVNVQIVEYRRTYNELRQIYKELEAINFEATRSAYNAMNQRKLMTKELRMKIMIRDNYTCRCCGKYMPDGVGLHIDHITPIAKGGKTVESNLQVLCSKCNGHKSSK